MDVTQKVSGMKEVDEVVENIIVLTSGEITKWDVCRPQSHVHHSFVLLIDSIVTMTWCFESNVKLPYSA